ncbi:AGE family epimerase/isomerase [Teichococcus vastitatis]|uniref:AGE family epimerase/isomerase n=1 Tax=Teichococcus vastitatis TaxID=2307076 RepID=A0ABS9WC27_9PROT|nr:AGE family epimerase/isomerase [Pseudoroseomonas vastitatis]MCI0756862.1 AGE family epimerase/isomerase [Pseudoroseomonas vastitatis]
MHDLWSWLAGAAWPLWLSHGVDWREGAFHESLDLESRHCPVPFRRLRVAARQVYSFSLAQRHGLPRADEAVELGLRFLRRHAARPDGGYAWRFSLDNQVIDDRRDLYDHAFVLLALSTAATVQPGTELRDAALALDDFIEHHLTHAEGGYLESLPPDLPRRQNPHMHLLEARLAAAASFGDQRFLDAAGRLVALFRTRLFQPGSGTLAEFFTDDLRPMDDPHPAEPGHACEWIWLLDQHARLAGVQAAPEEAAALQRFVDGWGRDPGTGALFDVVGSDGTIRSAGARLWPQAERLKSAALRRHNRPDDFAEAGRVLHGYLRPDGLWHERRLPDGSFSGEPAPASSLYHLSCAITEVRDRCG